MKYSQCKLFKNNGDGSVSWKTAWIPQKFPLEAKLTIKLKDDNGDWETWMIYKVYHTEEEKDIKEGAKNRRRHRKESDI